MPCFLWVLYQFIRFGACFLSFHAFHGFYDSWFYAIHGFMPFIVSSHFYGAPKTYVFVRHETYES